MFCMQHCNTTSIIATTALLGNLVQTCPVFISRTRCGARPHDGTVRNCLVRFLNVKSSVATAILTSNLVQACQLSSVYLTTVHCFVCNTATVHTSMIATTTLLGNLVQTCPVFISHTHCTAASDLSAGLPAS